MSLKAGFLLVVAMALVMPLCARSFAYEGYPIVIDCDEFEYRGAGVLREGFFEIFPAPGQLLLRYTRDTIEDDPEPVVFRFMGREYRATELPRTEEFYLRFSDGFSTGWRSIHADRATLEHQLFYMNHPRAWSFLDGTQDRYSNVYPGIDFGHHRDLRQLRFVFRPGSSPSTVKFTLDPIDGAVIEPHQTAYLFRCGRLVLGRPVLVRLDDAEDVDLSVGYVVSDKGVAVDVRDEPAPLEDELGAVRTAGFHDELAGEFALVPASAAGVDAPYDFFAAKHETTNLQFIRFLNDLEGAPEDDAIRTNVFFDAEGNLWFNPARQAERDELFSIGKSRIVYNPQAEAGARYGISQVPARDFASYTNHPVTGVSWYGALKYCNWLTLQSGRGFDALAYREGTNSIDWAPITSAETNWVRGIFTDDERKAFVQRAGFRLPMDDSVGKAVVSTNRFNEFIRMSVSAVHLDAPFGHGHAEAVPENVNFTFRPFFKKRGTSRVAFYDGSDYDGRFQTHSNLNAYSIFDLSGNVREWLTDPGETNLLYRASLGGGWFDTPQTVFDRDLQKPWQTTTFTGFRVATASSGAPTFVMIIPYAICGGGFQVELRPKEPEEPAIPREREPPEEVQPFAPVPLPGLIDPGVIIRVPPPPPIPPPRPRPPDPLIPPDACP